MKKGVWVDPPRFFAAIKEAGYQARPDDVRLTVAGKVTRSGERLLLTVDVTPGPQVFVLVPAPVKNSKEQAAFTAAYRSLDGLVGQSVELEGGWRPPGGDGRAFLHVRSARPASSPKKD